MKRIPEPEVMDGVEQSEAYAQADFAAVNAAFVQRFLEHIEGPPPGSLIDLGCGPGDIPLRLAEASPTLVDIVGVDASAPMLELARRAVSARGLAPRVRFVQALLPDLTSLSGRRFDAVVSNSLLHHLHDPSVLWRVVSEVAAPDATILVVDLLRPATEADAQAIVDAHAEGEPEVLRRDFFNSLLAAFTLDEARDQLEAAGLSHLSVSQISDRHLCVAGRR